MKKSLFWAAGWVVLVLMLVGIMPTGIAQAYLDPGSGSLLIQIIIAGILGLLVAIKLYWSRIVAFFTGRTPPQETESPDPNEVASDDPQ